MRGVPGLSEPSQLRSNEGESQGIKSALLRPTEPANKAELTCPATGPPAGQCSCLQYLRAGSSSSQFLLTVANTNEVGIYYPELEIYP